VDIPEALRGRDDAVATRPLGPDRAVSLALAQRLADVRGVDVAAAPEIALVATGSSDPDAAEDLAAAAADLAALLETPVHATVMSGPGIPFADEVARLGPHHIDVVPYLLAEGVFFDRLRDEARAMGVRTVGGPLGAHPQLAELVLARYTAAVIAPTDTDSRGR
jgi:sirohydrochlorin ferrochelatase